jgi:carboxymethylenebutenolidase
MRQQLPSGTQVDVARAARAERGVVISPDVRGLRPLFADMACRLANEHGWAAAVVDPFPDAESLDRDERLELLARRPDIRAMDDLCAAADLLDVPRVGVLGFCLGGIYALKAATLPRFDRVVAFYGMIRLSAIWRRAWQADAIDLLRTSGRSSVVLSIVAGQDPLTPAADVDELEALGAVIVRYPDAHHAFAHDPALSAHRPDDAADAWHRACAWLA